MEHPEGRPAACRRVPGGTRSAEASRAERSEFHSAPSGVRSLARLQRPCGMPAYSLLSAQREQLAELGMCSERRRRRIEPRGYAGSVRIPTLTELRSSRWNCTVLRFQRRGFTALTGGGANS